jgi:hypothetical protein
MAAVSAYLSKLFYGTKPQVAADGIASIVVKIRLRDVNDRPLAGYRVTLHCEQQVEIEQPDLTNAEGYACGKVRSAVAGFFDIIGVVDAVRIGSSSSSASVAADE